MLADRICVLSPRPGRVVAELPVDAPAPAQAHRPEVVALRERALEALRVIAPLVLLAAFIGALGALHARSATSTPLILPAPHEVAQSLWDDRSLLLSNLSVTAQEVGLGARAGADRRRRCSAFALHLSPRAAARRRTRCSCRSQAVPFVILAPLLVFWLGFSIGAKLAIVVLVCFFPIVVDDARRPARVDPELLQAHAHARRLALADAAHASKRPPRCPPRSPA